MHNDGCQIQKSDIELVFPRAHAETELAGGEGMSHIKGYEQEMRCQRNCEIQKSEKSFFIKEPRNRSICLQKDEPQNSDDCNNLE